MRKFKLKNRQRRKYVKKSDRFSQDSLTRTAWYGFVPFSLIAVAFLATMLISNPAVTKGMASMSIPHEVGDTLTRPFQLGYQTLTSTKISTPKVNPSPVTNSFSGSLTFFIRLLTTFGEILVTMSKQFIGITGQLALSSIRLVGAGVHGLLNNVTMIIDAVISVIQRIGRGVLSFIQVLGNLTLSLLRSTGMFLISLFNRFIVILHTIFQACISVIMSMFHMITYIFTTIGQVIAEAYQGFLHILKTPFILLGKAYKQIEPGLLFIVKGVGDATNELIKSIATILNVTAKLSHKN